MLYCKKSSFWFFSYCVWTIQRRFVILVKNTTNTEYLLGFLCQSLINVLNHNISFQANHQPIQWLSCRSNNSPILDHHYFSTLDNLLHMDLTDLRIFVRSSQGPGYNAMKCYVIDIFTLNAKAKFSPTDHITMRICKGLCMATSNRTRLQTTLTKNIPFYHFYWRLFWDSNFYLSTFNQINAISEIP